MEISALSAQATTASGMPGRTASVSKQEFLQLLVAQLRNQDPLKPMDNQEFIAQLAQLQTLDQMENLVNVTQMSLETEAVSQSLALLGQRVEYQVADGDTQVGTVQRIRVSGGLPILVVDGQEVMPGNVVGVSVP